jgi:hypothetical protein
MHYLSDDFVTQRPECLDAKDSLDLMIALSEHDPVATLTDLLSLTAMAEREYARLRQYQKKSPETVI